MGSSSPLLSLMLHSKYSRRLVTRRVRFNYFFPASSDVIFLTTKTGSLVCGAVRHVKLPNARDHDIQFNIANNLLYAHRAVVAVRCPNLLVKACKEKTVKKGIYRVNVDDRVVDEYSLHAILWYLYTDDVQFSQMENTQVVKLVLIAEMYELERLVWYCARYLQAIISVGS
jgi:hypothetical protein